MISIPDKKGIFTLERVWFPDDGDRLNSRADIVRLLRVNKGNMEFKNSIKELNYTLITNLDESEDGLFLKMRRSYKSQIQRCLNEDVAISIYETKQVKENPDILSGFYSTYMHYCDSSGRPELKKNFDMKKINSYIDNNCITISIADFKDGKVYHMYVHDEKNTVILYSASDFRNDYVDRNLAGRANKLLHYKDMIYFKDMNVHSYDWGNVTSFTEPNGVDAFKMAFGGNHAEVYNIFIGNSLKGKILVGLRRIVYRKQARREK